MVKEKKRGRKKKAVKAKYLPQYLGGSFCLCKKTRPGSTEKSERAPKEEKKRETGLIKNT